MRPSSTAVVTAILVTGVLLTAETSFVFARVAPGGTLDDDQASLVYWSLTGEVAIDAPVGREFSSFNISSDSAIFTEAPAENLGGSFDNDSDPNIFKATFGGSFSSLSFGNVAPPGLDESFLLEDLTIVGSLWDGGDLGDVDLVYRDVARLFNVSFSRDADVNSLEVDFGTVRLYENVLPVDIELTNLTGVDGIGSTASLDLVAIDVSGRRKDEALTTDLVPFANLRPGDTRTFMADLNTTAAGQFSSDSELYFANSADPFEKEMLRIHLTGTVLEPPVGAVIAVEESDGTLPSILYDPVTGDLSLKTDFRLISCFRICR